MRTLWRADGCALWRGVAREDESRCRMQEVDGLGRGTHVSMSRAKRMRSRGHTSPMVALDEVTVSNGLPARGFLQTSGTCLFGVARCWMELLYAENKILRKSLSSVIQNFTGLRREMFRELLSHGIFFMQQPLGSSLTTAVHYKAIQTCIVWTEKSNHVQQHG